MQSSRTSPDVAVVFEYLMVDLQQSQTPCRLDMPSVQVYAGAYPSVCAVVLMNY